MLGEYIKQAIRELEREQERQQSDQRIKFLTNLPHNTFSAIYDECGHREWAGCHYNGIYYSEAEIYYASLNRDEGYEQLI